MTILYQHPVHANQISARIKIPEKEGDYLYLIRLNSLETDDVIYKIGTTCHPMRRLIDLIRAYKYEYDIEVLWFSPPLAKFTTLKVEDKMKNQWKQIWEYIPNDRFRIPNNVTEVKITIKKDYIILI